MDIFKVDTRVEGKVVGGTIRDGIFHMSSFNPSNTLVPPIKVISFDKRWLDLTIQELQAIRDKL